MSIGVRHSGVRNSPYFSGLIIPKIVVTTINTAWNVAYTAAQLWGGEIHRDTNGGNRTDTLPSAHDLVVAMDGVEPGSTIDVVIRNDAATTDVLTIAAGAGGTTSGTLTVAQNATNRFRLRFTNITYPSEAYEVTGFTATSSGGGGSGDALVANPLSQFAATSSLQLKGVISDETGSGALVFAQSPSIVTPAIASFANANHSHLDSAGGGTITPAAVGLGNVDNTSDATKNAATATLTNKTLVAPNIGAAIATSITFATSGLLQAGTSLQILQNGGDAGLTVSQNLNNSPWVTLGRGATSSTASNVRVQIGANALGDFFSGVSGAPTDLLIAGKASPGSTSSMVYAPLAIKPVINFSAGTPGAGSYEAIQIAVTETALPTGTNYLIRAKAGAAGTTDKFAVMNTGSITHQGYHELTQMTPPVAGAATTARFFADNSGGKTRLMVQFPTGTAIQIAIEA